MADGFHAVKYDDGDQYGGQWSGEGKRHGLGVLNFADGTEYAGEFADGMNHGFGVLTFTDKSSYDGEFENGKVQGFGKITFPDGSSGRPRQEGTFADRKLSVGGKQQTAVNQAKEAKATAEEKAGKAKAMA